MSAPRLTKLVKIALSAAKESALFLAEVSSPGAKQRLTISTIGTGTGWPTNRRRLIYAGQVVNRLRKQGLMELVKESDRRYFHLTPKGERLLAQYDIGELTIKKPRHWDGKYHLIIFDIAERRRRARDEIRLWLENLGFIRLQNSVWVYPYECQEVINLLKTHFDVRRDLLYLIVDFIENDKWLRRHFGLI